MKAGHGAAELLRGVRAGIRRKIRKVVDREVALAQARARGDLLEAALLRTRRELVEARRKSAR